MRFVYRRGPGAGRRVMHIAFQDPRTGEVIMRPLCGQRSRFDTVNRFLGAHDPICAGCARAARRLLGVSR